MAKTIVQGEYVGANIPIAQTFIQPFGTSDIPNNEGQAQTQLNTGGTLSNFFFGIRTNTINATRTIRIRKNGTNGSQSVSVPSSSTGHFQDNTNTDSISPGDDIAIEAAAAGSSGNMQYFFLGYLFAATTDTATIWCVSSGNGSGNQNYNGTSTSYYSTVAGFQWNSTNETYAQMEMQDNGTWKNLTVKVRTNARTTTTTARTRKNGGNGNQSVSISASSTGIFTDSTNTDTLVAGDDICYQLVTGTGTENFRVDCINSDFVTTDSIGQCTSADNNPATIGSGATQWNGIAAIGPGDVPNEDEIDFVTQLAFTGSRMGCRVSANSLNGSTTLRTRKNANNGNQSVSIGSSTTGLFTDTTHTDSYAIGDIVNYQIVTGGTSGNIAIRSTWMLTSVGGASLITRSCSGTAQVATSADRWGDLTRNLSATAQSASSLVKISIWRRILTATAQSLDTSTVRLYYSFRTVPATAQASAAAPVRRLYSNRAIHTSESSIQLAGVLARIKYANRAIAATLIQIDSLLQKSRLTAKSISDQTVTLASVLSQGQRIVPRLRQEYITVNTVVSRFILIFKAIPASVTIDTVLLRIGYLNRPISNPITISTSPVPIKTAMRSIAGSCSIGSAVDGIKGFFRVIQETVDIDSTSIDRLTTIVKSINNTLQIDTLVEKFSGTTIELIEGISIYTEPSRVKTFLRGIINAFVIDG